VSTNKVRRFGALIPPGNVAVEAELPNFLPRGVKMNTNRLYRRTVEVSFDSLSEMLASAEQSGRGLSHVYPEVILFACTSGSFINGPGTDLELAKRIEVAAGGVPVITTSTAAGLALRSINARRVFVVTPYTSRLNDLEIEFFKGNGFEVTRLVSIPCKDTVEIREIPSERIANLVREHAAEAKTADAVFLTCTNLHTMDQLAVLEAELGVPVLSSNQASLWAALDKMGITATARGGRMMTELRNAA
jgi:maleate isomerase